MTEQQALQLLDNICAQVTLSRADHVKVQEAVNILSACVENQAPVEKPVKSK